jgi:hypothetical protein
VFRTKFRVIDAIKYGKSSVYMLYMQDDKNKVKGKLYLKNFSIKTHYSFLDLYFKNKLNVVPVIGVDFSLANLTFDENQKCIHTLK